MPSNTRPRSPLRLKEMRPPDVAAALLRDARLVVPVGACAQHAPHLPVCGETLIAERLADDLSAEFRVLRAPTIEYGVNIPTERETPGDAGMRRKSMHRMLNDLLSTWEGNRIKQFILLTAHGNDAHMDALSMATSEESELRVIDVLSMGIADLLEGQDAPLRGDEVETSLLLFIAPDLVDANLQDHEIAMAELRHYRRLMLNLPPGATAIAARPSLATADKGRAIYQRIYERIAARVFAHDVARDLDDAE